MLHYNKYSKQRRKLIEWKWDREFCSSFYCVRSISSDWRQLTVLNVDDLISRFDSITFFVERNFSGISLDFWNVENFPGREKCVSSFLCCVFILLMQFFPDRPELGRCTVYRRCSARYIQRWNFVWNLSKSCDQNFRCVKKKIFFVEFVAQLNAEQAIEQSRAIRS